MNKKFIAILVSILAICGIMAIAGTVGAQETHRHLNVAEWTRPTAITGVSGRETVIKVDDTYHIWYSPSDSEIYYASSTTPTGFATGTLCTFTGTAPAEVGSVTVLEEGGIFYMIAYGDKNDAFNIYTSTDGTTWTNKGLVFGGVSLPAYNKIDGPYLFKDNSTYRLYFQVKTPADTPTRYDIYTAEATGTTLAAIADGDDDADFTLANNNQPVLSPGAPTEWDGAFVMHPWVVKDGDTYYMWYSAHAGGATNQKIGLALSTDGYTWHKSLANPIISVGSVNYAEPSVINDNGTWRMWYDEASSNTAKYLTATGPFEFSTIQSAIDAAYNGDTINVTAGTYTEQLVINKSLTLQGTGAGTTIIQAPDTMTPTTWSHRGAAFQTPVEVNGATAHGIIVNIKGFTIDGFNKSSASPRYTGIVYHNANGTISNNIITKFGNTPPTGADGWGIFVVEGSNATISNNTIDKWGKGGIVVDGDADYTSTDVSATVTGNAITGAEEINAVAQNGVQISRGATGTVSANTITGNYYSGTDWSGSGILLYYSKNVLVSENILTGNQTGIYINGENSTYTTDDSEITDNNISGGKYGIALLHTKNTTITGNTINNNTASGFRVRADETNTVIRGNNITGNNTSNATTTGGILIETDADASKITVNFNKIVGNKQYGILNNNVSTLDATNNWWGNVSGPSGAGKGTGDAVSNNVFYDPWLGAEVENNIVTETEIDGAVIDAKNEADTEVIVTGGTATVTVAKYSANPGTGFSGDIGKYIDVHLDSGSGATELEIRLHYTDADISGKDESTLKMYWWNGTNWSPCSDTGVNTSLNYIWAKISSTSTTPDLYFDKLAGTPFAGAGNAAPSYSSSMSGQFSPSVSYQNKPEEPEITIEELEARVAELRAMISELQLRLRSQQALAYQGIPANFTFKNDLKYGMTSDEVKHLQIILKTEIGSPTYPEDVPATGWFGPITKAAVIKFQEKYASEILAPWNLTTGTGLVGSTTRAKLNSLLK